MDDAPLRPLTKKEVRLRERQEAEYAARLAFRAAKHAELLVRREKAKHAALAAGRRAREEARRDTRWSWLKAHSVRRPSSAPSSARALSHRRMERLPHECAAVARRSMVSGEGLGHAIALQTGHFQIEACDASGHRLATGGDPFVVAIRGCALVTTRVHDLADGSYICEYRVPVSGAFQVSVSLHGSPVAGSPYTLHVMRPQPRASKCVLRGAALQRAVAGELASFEIEYVDSFGHTTYAPRGSSRTRRSPRR